MKTQTIFLPNTSIKIKTNIRIGEKGSILFIHGLGCSKESFDKAFKPDRFSNYSLIAPDLPGFGDSSKDNHISFDLNSQAEYLYKLLAVLGVSDPVIVAHSMGGAIALLLIEKLESIKYFFCLEGNLIDEDCSISKIVASFSEEYFVEKKFVERPLIFRCRGLSSEPEANPTAFYKSSRSLVKLSETGELLEKYLDLKFPKTYMYGEDNKQTKVVSILKGEDIVEISGCGHFMMTDKPEETYDEINNRLSK